jgi:hypothetical protein
MPQPQLALGMEGMGPVLRERVLGTRQVDRAIKAAHFSLCSSIPLGTWSLGATFKVPQQIVGSPQSSLLCAKVCLGGHGSAKLRLAASEPCSWIPEAVGGKEVPMSLSSELLVREVSPTPPSLASHSVSKGMVVCNWVVILSVCITVLCVFDPTGRTFVKLRATKRRQRNLRTYNLRSVGQLGGWTVPY